MTIRKVGKALFRIERVFNVTLPVNGGKEVYYYNSQTGKAYLQSPYPKSNHDGTGRNASHSYEWTPCDSPPEWVMDAIRQLGQCE